MPLRRRQILKTYTRFDRTWQIWEDISIGGATLLVLKPGERNAGGYTMHEVLVLSSKGRRAVSQVDWYYENDCERQWEFDNQMERIA